MSCVCRDYHCVPSVALGELGLAPDVPWDMLSEIGLFRGLVQVHELYDGGPVERGEIDGAALAKRRARAGRHPAWTTYHDHLLSRAGSAALAELHAALPPRTR